MTIVTLAGWIVDVALAYALIGVVFALFFVTAGAGRIDPDAVRGTWGFRVLIFPGAAALWPFLALRWWHADAAHEERSPHRLAAREHDGRAA